MFFVFSCVYHLSMTGPRFVLNLIKIFGGSFGGPVLYENPHYVSPNVVSGSETLIVCICCQE